MEKIKTMRFVKSTDGGLKRLPDGECVAVRRDDGGVTLFRNERDAVMGITARMRCEAPEAASETEDEWIR